MNTQSIFIWLESAPAGLWAAAFVLLLVGLGGLSIFIWKYAKLILSGHNVIQSSLRTFTDQINKKFETLEHDMQGIIENYTRVQQEINSVKADLAELKGIVVTQITLKRIELFLEQLFAKGHNTSAAVLDALKFERETREITEHAGTKNH